MKTIITFFLVYCLAATSYAQTDTLPPLLSCQQQNLFVSVSGGCYTALWFSDIIDYNGSDLENNTVEYGLRRLCTGTGFPENKTSLIFTACDLGGPNIVELWARDVAGNTSSCQANIFVEDFAGNCDPIYRMTTNLPTGVGIPNTKIVIKAGSVCLADSIYLELLSAPFNNLDPNGDAGHMEYACFFAPPGYTTIIAPTKTGNYSNGVTPYDLVLIYRHILGITLLDSPYKIIAADANLDNQVNMDDLVLLKKWILGSTSTLEKGQSWRYVPKDFDFPDPTHPFATPFPEKIVVPNTAQWDFGPTNFIGVKIGDVNYSADPAH